VGHGTFSKVLYKWQLEEIPRCRSGDFNYFISKNGEKIPLNHGLWVFFFFNFKLQNFATIEGKKKLHIRRSQLKIKECQHTFLCIEHMP
jgi:hypothetical protein